MVHIASGNDLLGPKYREIQFIQWFFVTALIDSECCICVSTQGHVLPGVHCQAHLSEAGSTGYALVRYKRAHLVPGLSYSASWSLLVPAGATSWSLLVPAGATSWH